jgi:hypothetical protein
LPPDTDRNVFFNLNRLKDLDQAPFSVLSADRAGSRTWRECIKKLWEVEPLECSKCGGEMKIISFVDAPMLIHPAGSS